MVKATTDKSIPPPLRALGGWAGAEWFCPSVLSDDAVVGFTLPKLSGVRKQNFRLVERSVEASAGERRQTVGKARSGPPSVGEILDEAGVTRAAAFRRTTFLFESSPVLYFAEIPLSSLKIRAADMLRRTLVHHGLRGCIVWIDGKRVTAMIWSSAEADITRFIDEAAPPHPLHTLFDETEQDQSLQGGRPGSGQDQRRPRAKRSGESETPPPRPGERDALLRELSQLRARIVELQQSQSALGAMETLGLDDARLKSMLRLLHPDKHANSEAANEAAKWVNNLRDILKAKTPAV